MLLFNVMRIFKLFLKENPREYYQSVVESYIYKDKGWNSWLLLARHGITKDLGRSHNWLFRFVPVVQKKKYATRTWNVALYIIMYLPVFNMVLCLWKMLSNGCWVNSFLLKISVLYLCIYIPVTLAQGSQQNFCCP